MMRRIAGMAEIVDGYDALILDQFGVLHDGSRPYPGAAHCLEQLKAKDKRLIVLSNSGRRAAHNRRRLAALGFPESLFADVVTSGEAVWTALSRRGDAFHGRLGKRCLLISENGDGSFLDGLALERASGVETADFLLVVGLDAERALADHDPLLAAAADRRLPMLCANGDLVRITPAGLSPAPGALALRYERRGGEVRWYGKPMAPIFETCLAKLDGIERRRVLAVGDSLEHDILGARRAGLDSVYIEGGIGRNGTDDTLEASAAEVGAWPIYVVAAFRW